MKINIAFPVLSTDCFDKHSKCKQWAGLGECGKKYATWMEETCKKSCNKCNVKG